jgi:hypothetical protein
MPEAREIAGKWLESDVLGLSRYFWRHQATGIALPNTRRTMKVFYRATHGPFEFPALANHHGVFAELDLSVWSGRD